MNSKKFEHAIQKCIEEQRGLNRYAAIPVILNILNEMLTATNSNNITSEEKQNIAGGLFRIVSDDYNLLNSDIGKSILEAKHDFLI